MAEKEKVVLAYSGGLDTSVIVKWLQEEKNLDVIAICGNVGQDEKDLSWIKQKALDMGAIASEAVDMREEYAEKILSKAIWANGKYEGVYPLLSALSRPLISKHLVDIAHQYGAKYVAHGCTGKGNDQVRFETCIRALDPELEIIAPVRVWDLTTRDSEMEWAKQHGVPVPTTHKKPYSIDDNLWGRAIECGVLEDTWNKPPADIWTMTKNLDECPADPEEIVISFEQGIPDSGGVVDFLSVFIVDRIAVFIEALLQDLRGASSAADQPVGDVVAAGHGEVDVALVPDADAGAVDDFAGRLVVAGGVVEMQDDVADDFDIPMPIKPPDTAAKEVPSSFRSTAGREASPEETVTTL